MVYQKQLLSLHKVAARQGYIHTSLQDSIGYVVVLCIITDGMWLIWVVWVGSASCFCPCYFSWALDESTFTLYVRDTDPRT